ncbi:hypothetical protein [Ammoniphilus sp. CFH 90114]|uniref:hypothetical protein n=1 Tax=Ammoniphilus sp. CFH 90114 TaxID=2493665 RepID=UPI00100EC478|nr:hypothetical protein [Ammoniphilus sp. CFH 90114]RXT07988.1 hypothetical protein EIZ39_11280 [Ammoniphilus sp. CFH 90114]
MKLLLIVLILAALLFLYFTKKEKMLSQLEIVANYLFIATINQNVMALFTVGFFFLQSPSAKTMYWALVVVRLVISPIIILLFLQVYLQSNTIRKAKSLISYITLFVVIDGIMHATGLLVLDAWHWWWSVPKWLFILVSSILFMKFFRHSFIHKEEPHESRTYIK